MMMDVKRVLNDFKRFSEKIHILPLEEWAKTSGKSDTEHEGPEEEEQ